MASQQRQRGQIGLLTALLILIGLIGLTSGALTRSLLNATGPGHAKTHAPTPTATATPQPEPTTTLTPQSTAAPALEHFSIHLTISPTSGLAGSTITIAAHVTDNATGAPISGLTCQLRQPTNGAPGLFTTWPTPDATNDSGDATWSAQIPPLAPGRYVVEVFAQTPSWSYVARASVTVKSS